jgi:hypothetical protein
MRAGMRVKELEKLLKEGGFRKIKLESSQLGKRTDWEQQIADGLICISITVYQDERLRTTD